MKIWIYRIALFILLFGVSSMTYGFNQLSPVLTAMVNLGGLVGAAGLMFFYFTYPGPYKLAAWVITLSVIALVIESLHIYGQYVYSFFVIKRLAYCGLALLTFYVAPRAGELKMKWVVYTILAMYVVGQVFTGRILEYGFTSESRTTAAFEALYLVIPFLYFLLEFMHNGRRVDLLKTLAVFGVIFVLLHRSVITTALFAMLVVFGLSAIGKVATAKMRLGNLTSTLLVLAMIGLPFVGILSPKKLDAFLENIGGIAKPSEDETGSWRLEQSTYYWKGVVQRPMLGWRYEGYDKGEIMENEDFASKGTVIHSQYIDMLYNYGIAGLLLNLFIVGTTLWTMFRRNQQMSSEQTLLFAFILSGLLFGVSYQLPLFYWSFTGLGMFYGIYQRRVTTVPQQAAVKKPMYA
jgi:O-antigen ligase